MNVSLRAQKAGKTAAWIECNGSRNFAPPQPQRGAYRLRAVSSALLWQNWPARRLPSWFFPKQKIYSYSTALRKPMRANSGSNYRLDVVLRRPQLRAVSATVRRLTVSARAAVFLLLCSAQCSVFFVLFQGRSYYYFLTTCAATQAKATLHIVRGPSRSRATSATRKR